MIFIREVIAAQHGAYLCIKAHHDVLADGEAGNGGNAEGGNGEGGAAAMET